jgi:hypothetical protein
LVANEWVRGHYLPIRHTQGDVRAARFVININRLHDTSTDEHYRLIDTTANQLLLGDTIAITMEQSGSQAHLAGFARGRVYKPRYNPFKKEYVYLPDALAESEEALDIVITDLATRLKPDFKHVVVDVLKNNQRDAEMLRHLGFTSIGGHTYKTPELFAPMVGPEYDVVQYRA